MSIEIGRIVVKIAGRDAGKKGVIIDILDDKYVMLDGQVRRRKCNIIHIEPLEQKAEIEKNASHDKVKSILKEIGIEVMDSKPKEKTEKPVKVRKQKEVAAEEKSGKKKKEPKAKKEKEAKKAEKKPAAKKSNGNGKKNGKKKEE